MRIILKLSISLLTACIFWGILTADDSKSNIFYISDTIVLGSDGTEEYLNYLRGFIEQKSGKDAIWLQNHSIFDLNTSQIYTLVTKLLQEQSNIEFIIIMAGEANFYNITGFSQYLYEKGRYAKHSSVIEPYDINAVEKLNRLVAKVYNSPVTYLKDKYMKNVLFNACRFVVGNSPKKINGFVPKVIPEFIMLKDDTVTVNSIKEALFELKLKTAWTYINNDNLDEAEILLKELLKDMQIDSNVYYALGTVYLLKKKESIALKLFEDGILVDPFDKDNKCYKALSMMFMSYDGVVVSEIMYFAKVLKDYLGENIVEICDITAINTVDYNKKIAAIGNWINSSISDINELCKNKNIELIVSGYPLGAKANVFLQNAFALSSIAFVDNSNIDFTSKSKRNYENMAENVVNTMSRKNYE